MFKRVIVSAFTLFLSSLSLARTFESRPNFVSPNSKNCVILLHGLGRTARSLRKIENRLIDLNYIVVNDNYPSTEYQIQDLEYVINRSYEKCLRAGATDVYMVTHSLGGILARQHFLNRESDLIRAIVMMAPPNHGSEIVDTYRNTWWFQWWLGPAGLQLGTMNTRSLNRLGTPPVPVGIIAGTKSSDPWFAHVFEGPNDGKVSVDSTKLNGMKDFITVEASHPFIMNSSFVIQQIESFLKYREFDHRLIDDSGWLDHVADQTP